jgi:hypothetical protein
MTAAERFVAAYAERRAKDAERSASERDRERQQRQADRAAAAAERYEDRQRERRRRMAHNATIDRLRELLHDLGDHLSTATRDAIRAAIKEANR